MIFNKGAKCVCVCVCARASAVSQEEKRFNIGAMAGAKSDTSENRSPCWLNLSALLTKPLWYGDSTMAPSLPHVKSMQLTDPRYALLTRKSKTRNCTSIWAVVHRLITNNKVSTEEEYRKLVMHHRHLLLAHLFLVLKLTGIEINCGMMPAREFLKIFQKDTIFFFSHFSAASSTSFNLHRRVWLWEVMAGAHNMPRTDMELIFRGMVMVR
jgi:hypothetical protein